MKCGC